MWNMFALALLLQFCAQNYNNGALKGKHVGLWLDLGDVGDKICMYAEYVSVRNSPTSKDLICQRTSYAEW